MQQPHHHAARPPEGTASPSAVPWEEVRAARAVSVPSGALAAPLHRTGPQPSISVQIEARFPGVRCWWGLHTGHWWAYVPTRRGGRLVEAATGEALMALLAAGPWL